jgi:hypothetical protein
MRFAILIITYTSAQQTVRLIKKLVNSDFDFYIHLDKKIDISTHSELFSRPDVFFINDRVDVKWAGYTIVEAAFHGIRQIVASGIKYEFINLLSGQDYPIKSAEYISEFLSKNTGKQLIKCWDFETNWTEALGRVQKYHFTDVAFKGRYILQRVINTLIEKRKAPGNLQFFGTNSTFWTLTPDCALYVANYVETNPTLRRFLKYTWGSDEFVFQTIIMNSPYKDAVINNNYRYIDWSAGGSRPKTLTVDDYERIVATDNIFGRKFNVEVDAKILDLIDEENSIVKNGVHH